MQLVSNPIQILKKYSQTGPRTFDGKKRSSRNAVKHGCRAGDLALLPGEQQSDFDAVRQYWTNEYPVKTPFQLALVERLIMSDWCKRRCEREVEKQGQNAGLMKRYLRDANSTIRMTRSHLDLLLNR